MSSNTFHQRARAADVRIGLSAHWGWQAGGFGLALTLPFVLTDVLDLNRDVFYGLYAISVGSFVLRWSDRPATTSSQLRDATPGGRSGLASGAASGFGNVLLDDFVHGAASHDTEATACLGAILITPAIPEDRRGDEGSR